MSAADWRRPATAARCWRISGTVRQCTSRSRDAPINALWNAITMLVLVLRARQEITPGFGSILPAAEAERFAAAVSSAYVVEANANHYTITTPDVCIAALSVFLRTS